MPPDVRKGRAFPAKLSLTSAGAAPRLCGAAPKEKSAQSRKGTALPHIGRQSRKRYLGNEFSMARSSVAAFIVAVLLSVPCVTFAQTQTPAPPQTQPPRPQTPSPAACRGLLVSDFTVQELAGQLRRDDGLGPDVEAEVAPFDQVVQTLHELRDGAHAGLDFALVWTRGESSRPPCRS